MHVEVDEEEEKHRRSQRTKRIKFDLSGNEYDNSYHGKIKEDESSLDSNSRKRLKRQGSSLKVLAESSDLVVPEGRYGLRERSKRQKIESEPKFLGSRQHSFQQQYSVSDKFGKSLTKSLGS